MSFAAAEGMQVGTGSQTLPAVGAIADIAPVFRVGVGIDVVSRSGWRFRFLFGQTLRSNPASEALRICPSQRYSTFHNVFGVVKYF